MLNWKDSALRKNNKVVFMSQSAIQTVAVDMQARTSAYMKKMQEARQFSKTVAHDVAGEFKKMAVEVVSAYSAFEVGRQIVDSAREFESLKQNLVVATGSIEDAGTEFKSLVQYAQDTPFALTEVTESFIKLKNYGLDPSQAAMTAYGNTAASMGKSLDQMIEAVADATQGEFERLKEFGIKASSQGDKIVFSFRGVQTTVKNTSEDIQQYLQNIGNTAFAGAMAIQMDTINGRLSNLGDQWDKTFAAIGNDASPIIKGTISVLSTIGEKIEHIFTSTEKLQELAQNTQLSVFGETDAQKLTEYNNQLDTAKQELTDAKIAMDSFADSMKQSGIAVDANSTVYSIYSTRVDNAKESVTQLEQKIGDLKDQMGLDSEFDKIQKQFDSIDAKNAAYYKDQAAQQAEQQDLIRKNRQEALYQQTSDEMDAWQASADAQAAISQQMYDNEQAMRLNDAANQRQLRDMTFEEQKAYWAQVESAKKQHDQLMMTTYTTVSNFASQSLGKLMAMQNTASKAGFENYKKMAIAQTVIDTAQAAIAAYRSVMFLGPAGIPIGAAMAAIVAGIGAAQVAQISSQQFQPTQVVGVAHDGIDNVPREGTWLLDGGERVVDKRTNADLKQALANGSIGGGIDSVVVNNYGAPQPINASINGRTLEIIIGIATKAADSKIAEGINKGTSQVGAAMAKTYGLNR
jgi:hypothetical protein